MAGKNNKQAVQGAIRDELVLRLKAQGWRNHRIAEHIGCSAPNICRVIKKELTKLREAAAESREEWRALELVKLDERERATHKELAKLDKREQELYQVVIHQPKRLSFLEYEDALLRVSAHRTRHQNTLSQIATHRAKLLHLENPKVLIPVSVPPEMDPLAGVDVAAVVAEAQAWQPPRLTTAETVPPVESPEQPPEVAHACNGVYQTS